MNTAVTSAHPLLQAVILHGNRLSGSAPDCLTVVGWYRRGLELRGARGVRVSETEWRAKGGTVCRYEVSWT